MGNENSVSALRRERTITSFLSSHTHVRRGLEILKRVSMTRSATLCNAMQSQAVNDEELRWIAILNARCTDRRQELLIVLPDDFWFRVRTVRASWPSPVFPTRFRARPPEAVIAQETLTAGPLFSRRLAWVGFCRAHASSLKGSRSGRDNRGNTHGSTQAAADGRVEVSAPASGSCAGRFLDSYPRGSAGA